MKYKVLITDIDRTFSKQGRIFPENIEYLNYLKKKNIILVANTGRGLNTGKSIMDLNIFDYFIGNNGSFIMDMKKNNLVYEKQMLAKNANDILKIIHKYQMPSVIENMNNVYFTDTPETRSEDFLINSNYKFNYITSINKNINRMLIMLNTKNSLKFMNEIKKFLSINKDKFNYFYNDRTLEIMNKNVSKGNALLKLLGMLNISTDNILVIGDSINDVSMLKLTKLSIAMRDSDSITKKHAKHITDSEKNKGWLKGVQHYE